MRRETVFFSCPHCGNQVTLAKGSDVQIACCGEPALKLIPNAVDACSAQHLPEVSFTGGYTANAAKIGIGNPLHPMTAEHHIKWIYLRTVQGGQFKYLQAGKPPVLSFALTDLDGYSYCDRQICLMGKGCKFKCKQGFVAYAYCNLHGLWQTRT